MTALHISPDSVAPRASVLPPAPFSGAGLPLARRDLLAFERLLLDDVARILPFEAHALYFPTDDEAPAPVWIEEEEKLLLPLRRDGNLLGVLLLRRPRAASAASCGDSEAPGGSLAALLPYLPGMVDLCLDKLALYKWGRTDALTGLSTRAVLLERLGREVDNIRRAFAAGLGLEPDAGGSAAGVGESAYQATLGLIVVRLTGLRAVQRGHGHGTAERLLAMLGATLQERLPAEAVAARTGDSEFAVLWPGAVRQPLEELARDVVRGLDAVRLPGPLTGVAARAVAHAGYALFPQDWAGGREAREPAEEAEALFDKARLAAQRAGDLGANDDHVLGYGVILPKGGVVDQVLPLSRVRTTLGRDVGAREGQRFSVWSLDYPVRSREGAEAAPGREPLYKGEIVLADVREDSSQAEVLLLGDPAWPLEPGDRLTLLPEDYGAASVDGQETGGRPDPLTGLYRHGDFLARLAVARERHPVFGLILARFELPALDREGRPLDLEHGMAEAASVLRRLVLEKLEHAATSAEPEAASDGGERAAAANELLAGRYSLNGLLLFHPGLVPGTAREMYVSIGEEVRRRLGCGVALGVACLPWLTFRAADALECCRKALEYALLLPEPHVGVFDSLAVNISADKRYSQGDVFGAMEEYRLALLADEENTLAWNSLGVCLAGLGRAAEARRAFEEAARRKPGDPAGHYNLGTACVTLGDAEAAAVQFRSCLDLDPGHVYACVRLGELAESRGDSAEARRRYEQALEADPASSLPHRCLARLEWRERRPDKARERLHQSLLRDPQDAFSLHLMARLYLDGGEDPELAETLARQSVALRPDRKAAWLELARALEAQGRHRDAREARVRAAGL